MNRREKALRPLYLAGPCPACGARAGEACRNAVRGGTYHTYLHAARTRVIDTAYRMGVDEGADPNPGWRDQ